MVVDDRTMDGTVAKAQARGARVEVRPFADFARQRNSALEMARAEWVLFVDADEVVTHELATEVRETLGKAREEIAGYWIPRKNLLFGRWIRHAGWSPDRQLRLLRRDRARYREDRTVHELVDLQGDAGHLRTPFVHYNYDTIGQFVAKQKVYASMEAADLYRRGIRPRPQNYLLQPWRQFWRRYVLLEGFKDGALGLILSLLLAYFEWRTYVELRSLWRGKPRENP